MKFSAITGRIVASPNKFVKLNNEHEVKKSEREVTERAL